MNLTTVQDARGGYDDDPYSYDWSYVGWFKDEDDNHWLATDGGCSCCNSALEYWDWETLESLQEEYDPTGPLTYEQALEEYTDLTEPESGYSYS